jgi:hypothetical protein
MLAACGRFLRLFQLQLFQLRHRGGCCVLSMTGLVPSFTLGNGVAVTHSDLSFSCLTYTVVYIGWRF